MIAKILRTCVAMMAEGPGACPALAGMCAVYGAIPP